MRKAKFGYKFSILSFFLLVLVLSLIYQIFTSLYCLLSYNHRLRENEQLLQEKLNLVENLEAKIQRGNSWPDEPGKEAPSSENSQ